MKNNIDEDISNVNFLIRDLKAMSYNETFINSISNVLTQLNTNKYDINNYEERITSLKSELETYKEEFKKINKALSLEEGIVEPYTTDIIEGLKRCVTQQHKELETYKKIAKRLAKEILSVYPPIFNMVTVKNMEILIDIVRKEVEKEQ